MACPLNLIPSPHSCFCLHVVSQVFLQHHVTTPGLTTCPLCPQERDGMRAILGSYDSELTPAEYSPQLTRRMREAEDMVQKVHAHSSEMEVSAAGCLPSRPLHHEASGHGPAARRGGPRRGCGGSCHAQTFSPDLRSTAAPLSHHKYGCTNSHFVTTLWLRVKR